VAYENTDGAAEVAAGGTGAGAGVCGEPGASDSLRTFGAFVQALREHAGLSPNPPMNRRSKAWT
jgi:hypothetical protein